MKLKLATLILLSGFSWADSFTPLVLTNAGDRYLAFPAVQGPMVLYTLRVYELQAQIIGNRETLITNLSAIIENERLMSAKWRDQVDAERRKAQAEKKQEWVTYAIVGGGGVLVGMIAGALLMGAVR